MTVERGQVVVLGLGPAGRAMAHRLAAAGIDVVAVDPVPDRVWRPTYALWADELPTWVVPEAVATRSAARAWAVREHELRRDYLVLDTPGLQHSLTLDGVRLLAGRVEHAEGRRARLTDGRAVEADLVLDARGSRPHPDRAQQTAIGIVVRRDQGPGLEQTWFMDWRADNGTGPGDPPSFLYAVGVDADHVLLEETCLVGRPALGADELRRRLHARLAARGIAVTGAEREERVRFSVEPETSPLRSGRDRPRVDEPVAIGARGGMMHPATGYSVAVSLSVADQLSGAVAAGARTPEQVAEVLWSPAARRSHGLQRIGLTTLLRLPPHGTVEFFEAFFSLPARLQRSYLSQRDRPVATLAAMASMAMSLRPSLSRIAVTSALDHKITT